MESGKKRNLIYVATAIIGALIVILAVLLLQQPIQPKTTPPPAKTAPLVSTLAASGVGQTGATLNGHLGDLGSASDVFVGFLYGTDPGFAGATNTTVAHQNAAAAYLEAVDGLTPGTTYYFEAWALGDGFSTGTATTFTTLTPPTPQTHAPSVTTGGATGVGTVRATLNGNVSSLGTASSVSVGFLVGTSPTLAGADNLTVGPQSSVGAYALAIQGLDPNTTYYVQAWGAGDGFASGSIVSFKTTAGGSGNGHQVPPGWAHAACPEVPKQAKAFGLHARCELNETYGQWKKEHPGSTFELVGPPPSVVEHGAAFRTSDPGTSGSHRSNGSHVS